MHDAHIRFHMRLGCSTGNAPTIYDQRLAGHAGGLVGGQKQHRVGNFLGGTDTTERSLSGTGGVIFSGHATLSSILG